MRRRFPQTEDMIAEEVFRCALESYRQDAFKQGRLKIRTKTATYTLPSSATFGYYLPGTLLPESGSCIGLARLFRGVFDFKLGQGMPLATNSFLYVLYRREDLENDPLKRIETERSKLTGTIRSNPTTSPRTSATQTQGKQAKR